MPDMRNQDAQNETRVAWARAALSIVLTSGLLIGCGPSNEASEEAKLPAGSTLLHGGGATFPAPLYEKWFADYHAKYPERYIKYEAVGSGEGVRRFIGKNIADKERVDFGASDAALQDSELAQADNNALMIPVTAGCVVLAYNLPQVRGRLRLSRRAYA